MRNHFPAEQTVVKSGYRKLCVVPYLLLNSVCSFFSSFPFVLWTKSFNYVHSSLACLVCTIILTVAVSWKLLRTRWITCYFVLFCWKLYCFTVLLFTHLVCTRFSFRLVTSRARFVSSREQLWIEGNQFEKMSDSAEGGGAGLLLLLVITCVSKLRKGSSAALWSQCSVRSFCSGVSNILESFCCFIFLFTSLVHVYIDKAFYVLLFQQFRLLLVNIVVLTISYRKTNTHDFAEKFKFVQKNVYQFRMLPFLCWSSLW